MLDALLLVVLLVLLAYWTGIIKADLCGCGDKDLDQRDAFTHELIPIYRSAF